MTSPFYLIKKVLRIVAIILPVLTGAIIFSPSAHAAPDCTVLPASIDYYDGQQITQSFYVTLPSGYSAGKLQIAPGSSFTLIPNTIGVGNLAYDSPFIWLAEPTIYTNVISNSYYASLTLDMTPLPGNTGTSDVLDFNHFNFNNFQGSSCRVTLNKVVAPTPVATIFSPNDILQYTSGFVGLVTSNIQYIIGVMAFCLGSIWVFSMFSGASKGSIDKVKMLSSDGFGSGGAPKYGTQHPDDYTDDWKTEYQTAVDKGASDQQARNYANKQFNDDI